MTEPKKPTGAGGFSQSARLEHWISILELGLAATGGCRRDAKTADVRPRSNRFISTLEYQLICMPFNIGLIDSEFSQR